MTFTLFCNFLKIKPILCIFNAVYIYYIYFFSWLFSDPPPVAMEIDIKPDADADAGSDDSPAGIIFFSF